MLETHYVLVIYYSTENWPDDIWTEILHIAYYIKTKQTTTVNPELGGHRNRFIVTNLRARPNILKFKQILSAYQKQNLEKLCKFIRNINKSFVLEAVSHSCLCCIYCI